MSFWKYFCDTFIEASIYSVDILAVCIYTIIVIFLCGCFFPYDYDYTDGRKWWMKLAGIIGLICWLIFGFSIINYARENKLGHLVEWNQQLKSKSTQLENK